MKRRILQWCVVLAGVALGQMLLYGPCLAGRKILLPLDVLTIPGVYIPRTPEIANIEPRNWFLSDLVYLFEPARRFAVAELHDGRLPMWAPYQFCGAPVIWPKFSPFLLLECVTASPVILAWSQLLASLVAGLGMYLFAREALKVAFWPATIVAWCYPLTGFFVFWIGFATSGAVYWLPWILLAVEKTARCSSPWAPVALSAVTCLVLASGHLDVAGQVLLTAGLYAGWCLFDTCRRKWLQPQARQAVLKVGVATGLGILLATPYLLPVMEYSHEGARMARRGAGQEERPPVGIQALPQTVLPYMYGSLSRSCGYRVDTFTEMETSAGAYAGVVATLLIAPLAWFSRSHRSRNFFWAALALLGLSWCVNLPGLVQLLRLPGLNMLSHNRWVFATAFAILALAAVGLDVLIRDAIPWRKSLWLPLGILAVMFLWCGFHAFHLPHKISPGLEQLIQNGGKAGWTSDLAGVHRIQAWFVTYYAVSAVFCGAAIFCWLALRKGRTFQKAILPMASALMVADLLWFAHGRLPQTDPALYYPAVPVLDQVARAAPHDRIIGYDCLPASLAAMSGLSDIRGYDGVDPRRMVALIKLAIHDKSEGYAYAATQWISPPKVGLTPAGDARLTPLLNMLGVRHVIFRKSPPKWPPPTFLGTDYWVLENRSALPRVFVPSRVELAEDERSRLEKLGSARFDAREVAYVESPVSLAAPCRGSAEILSEIPTRVTVAVQMETPGLLVLADQWDAGWRARLGGSELSILRVNHALRGVVCPAGSGTVEFRYEPASFKLGLILCGAAATALLGWIGYAINRGRTISRVGPLSSSGKEG